MKFTAKWSESKYIYWFFALVATLLFMGWYGYWFNIGDQEEHLPQVYKLINPKLYPKDYFMVPNAETFSVRFYYKWLVYLLSFPLGVANACFLLTFTTIFVSGWAVSKMSMYFDDSKFTAFVAPVLLLWCFNEVTIGDNSFADDAVVCSSFACMFCSLAFLQYFKERYVLLAVLVGLGGLFQVLESLIGITLLCSLMVFHRRVPVLKVIGCFLLYLLVVSPMLGPIVYRQFLMHVTYDKKAFYEALYDVRNPNHYLPSTFPVDEYVIFFAFMAVALIGAVVAKIKNLNFIIWLTVIVAIGSLGYYVALEKLGVLVIGKTQWFKATIWLTLFYSICIAVIVQRISVKFFDAKKLLERSILAGVGVTFILCLVIFESKYNPIHHFTLIYRVGNYQKGEQQLMHEWIAEHTANDAVFLASPGDVSFLSEAHRSLLIGYKAVIHEPYF